LSFQARAFVRPNVPKGKTKNVYSFVRDAFVKLETFLWWQAVDIKKILLIGHI